MVPTDIGMIVTDFLVVIFETDFGFIIYGKVERGFLMRIASGDERLAKVMKDFYGDFHTRYLDVEECR